MALKDPAKDQDYLLRGFLLLLWHRFPSWLIGQRISLKHVAFDHPAPKHLTEYRLMFPCPAKFDQAVTCLVFDAAILTAPLVQTPETLGHHLKRAPFDWFTRPAYYPVYTRRVLDHLERSEDLAETTIQSAALELHLTERTLRRKLAAEGSQFQRLKDGVRRDMAIHYLSQTSMSISLISQMLGFPSHPRSPERFGNGPASYPRTTETWRAKRNSPQSLFGRFSELCWPESIAVPATKHRPPPAQPFIHIATPVSAKDLMHHVV
jgi:AraC-like DNA-binding protein